LKNWNRAVITPDLDQLICSTSNKIFTIITHSNGMNVGVMGMWLFVINKHIKALTISDIT
jgi:hypothetical protein